MPAFRRFGFQLAADFSGERLHNAMLMNRNLAPCWRPRMRIIPKTLYGARRFVIESPHAVPSLWTLEMPGQIALTVSIKIQPADPTAARNRILPDPGVHRAPIPLDIARKSDVYR